MNPLIDPSKLKAHIKSEHKKLMLLVPEDQREDLQRKMDLMIDKAKAESNNPFMNDFMKEIYNK